MPPFAWALLEANPGQVALEPRRLQDHGLVIHHEYERKPGEWHGEYGLAHRKQPTAGPESDRDELESRPDRGESLRR